MSRDSDNKFRWKALIPVLNEHTLWFHDLLYKIFYSDVITVNKEIQKPLSFAKWTAQAQSKGDVQPEVIEKLSRVHNELIENASKLMAIAGNVKPDYVSFKNFMTIYEEFQFFIRRLETDFVHEDSGYDVFTGLRSVKLLYPDVEKELQRLARQGRNFCLVVARIDHFSELSQSIAVNEVDGYVKLVAEILKISIRTYDDAYYFGDGEFILCLKQADADGGISALERIRDELEQQKIECLIQGVKTLLSMSCCISEPIETDRAEDIVQNLREFLAVSNKKTDSIFEYFELSPLQRFIREEKQQ